MPTPQAAMAISNALSSTGRSDPGRLWADVLADMPLFAGVPKRHLRKIAALTKEMRFESQTPIVTQGERGDAARLDVVVEEPALASVAAVERPGARLGVVAELGDLRARPVGAKF